MTKREAGRINAARRNATTAVGIAAAILAAAGAQAQGPASHPLAGAAIVRGPAQQIPISFSEVIVSEIFTGKVEQIVDARTLLIRRDSDDHGLKPREVTVRLFGILADDPGENGGKARDFLSKNVKDQKVRVEVRHRLATGTLEGLVNVVREAPAQFVRPLDASGASSDLPRGASTGTMRRPIEQPMVNAALVRDGLARYDSQGSEFDKGAASRIAAAEAEARKDRRGIWAAPQDTDAARH